MAIDITKEKLLDLKKAAELCDVSYGAIRLHAVEGFRGVKLETKTIGGKSKTSIEAINRFSEKCAKIRAADLARDKENRLTAAADSVGRGEPFGTEEVPT